MKHLFMILALVACLFVVSDVRACDQFQRVAPQVQYYGVAPQFLQVPMAYYYQAQFQPQVQYQVVEQRRSFNRAPRRTVTRSRTVIRSR